MYVQNKSIIVVCEGPSERAYLQELNRYLDEEAIPIHFLPKSSGGGDYGKVIKKFKEERKANRRTEIIIWVDWDIYQRNDRSNCDNYRGKPDDIPDFHFSYKNFEDYLSMHCDRSELDKWVESCVGRDHFNSPSHSSEYIPAFITFIGGAYDKGDMPIEITHHSLNNLKTHQNDTSILFKCDFAKVLFELIDAAECS